MKNSAKIVSIIVFFFAVLVIVSALTGCDVEASGVTSDTGQPVKMTTVQKGAGYRIFRHEETGVYYFCRENGYGIGVCVMVNEDSTPYTADAEG